jgi:carbamoyl-phosphate synthase small subunit
VQVEGFIVRELTRVPSNFRSDRDLDGYLRAAGVVGIEGIDTRALVRRLRVRGAMTGVCRHRPGRRLAGAEGPAAPGMEGRDLVKGGRPGRASAGPGVRPTGRPRPAGPAGRRSTSSPSTTG